MKKVCFIRLKLCPFKFNYESESFGSRRVSSIFRFNFLWKVQINLKSSDYQENTAVEQGEILEV